MIAVVEVGLDRIGEMATYGEAFLRENGYANFAPDRFIQYWTTLVRNARGVIFGAYDGLDLVGAISGFLCPNPYHYGTVAQEGFWYVRPEHRDRTTAVKLFRAFEAWASANADEIRVGCIAGPHSLSTGRFFHKQGYDLFEQEYRKVLRHG